MNPSKKLKQEFLTSVLNQLTEMAESVLKKSQMLIGDNDSLTEMQEKDLESISGAAQRLLTLIESLLTLELVQLEAEFDDAARQEYVSDQTMRPDFSSISHKFQAPTNSIIGFSRVMYKEIDGPITDSQKDILFHINKEGEKILELICQSVEAWRIEEHRAGTPLYIFEEESLWSFTGMTISWAGQEIKIEGDVPKNLVLHIDEVKLRKIIGRTNSILTSNDRYDSIIQIVEVDDHKVAFQMRNSGFSLADGVLEEFNRIDAVSTLFVCQQPGDVLDLCINQALTEIYGGVMRLVEDEENLGVDFIFPVQYIDL